MNPVIGVVLISTGIGNYFMYVRSKVYANLTRINILTVPKSFVANQWKKTSFTQSYGWNFVRNFGIEVDYFGPPISS